MAERKKVYLAEKGQVEDDLDGLSIGGHDDHLGDTTIQGLRGCIIINMD